MFKAIKEKRIKKACEKEWREGKKLIRHLLRTHFIDCKFKVYMDTRYRKGFYRIYFKITINNICKRSVISIPPTEIVSAIQENNNEYLKKNLKFCLIEATWKVANEAICL